MAKYELPIYGENDEITKTYKTNIVPWAIYIKSAEMSETIKGKKPVEQITEIGNIIKEVFSGLTDEELSHADSLDVMNTFKQITSGGKGLDNDTEGKNS